MNALPTTSRVFLCLLFALCCKAGADEKIRLTLTKQIKASAFLIPAPGNFVFLGPGDELFIGDIHESKVYRTKKGRLLNTIGAVGQGPNELPSFSLPQPWDEKHLLFITPYGMLELFSVKGEHIRTLNLGKDFDPASLIVAIAKLPNGHAAVYRRDGEVVRYRLEAAGREGKALHYEQPRLPHGKGVEHALSTSPIFDVSYDGTLLWGNPRGDSLQLVDPAGKVTKTHLQGVREVQSSEQVFRRFFQLNAEFHRRKGWSYDDIAWPETLPRIRQAIFDGMGRIWVRTFADMVANLGTDRQEWHVYDREGKLLDSVSLQGSLADIKGRRLVTSSYNDDAEELTLSIYHMEGP